MQSDEKIIIAIDGFSSCGKSTIAKSLAKELGYIFIDSGAMYRAIALYFLQNDISLDTPSDTLRDILQEIDVSLQNIAGSNTILLNGTIVNDELRSSAINNIVSEVAAMKQVREKLRVIQRELGRHKGIVMDGRDIGTVIFPQAELKVFVTADIEVRSQRRLEELRQKGIETSLAEVQENLLKRDHIDSTRKIAPLKRAESALLLDTTDLSREEQLSKIKTWVQEIISP